MANRDLESSRPLLWIAMAASIVLALVLVALFAVIGHDGAAAEGSEGSAAADVPPGAVLLMRHALTDRSQTDADPQARGGCDQQRNLSEEGVAQAERIGAGMADLPVSAVYASPFCRALDTGEALGVGEVTVEDGLISTTSGLDASAQQAIIDRALALVGRELGGEDVVVMVTHTQNIEAMTGMTVEEGDAVVLVPQGGASGGGASGGGPGDGIGVHGVVPADAW